MTKLRDDVKDIEFRVQGGFPYLAVFQQSGDMRAVGILDDALSQIAVDRFCHQVHGPVRSRDPAARSELVHTGNLDVDLKKQAARRGVLVKTWAEYQNLLDLSPYTNALRRWLAEDDLYPQDLYLPQRYRTVDKTGLALGAIENDVSEIAVDDILGEDSRFVLVLGDPGFGKSFLIRRLTHLLIDWDSGITPIVVLLRDWEKRHSLEEMVAQALADTPAPFQNEKFNSMFDRGRIVMLVDGYDEFAVRVGYGRAAEQLRTFLAALEGRREAKIVLTTRPSHFRLRQEAVSKIFENVLDLDINRRRVYELLDFDKEQQESFLSRWFGLHGRTSGEATAEAKEWMEALEAVDNLPELARTPRMLSFIAEHLDLAQVRAAATEQGPITAARLYEMLVDIWLTTETAKFDDDRARPGTGRQRPEADRRSGQSRSGESRATLADRAVASDRRLGRSQLTSIDRWRVAEELAYRLWATNETNISEALLEEVAGDVLDLPRLGMAVPEAAQEIGSRTLLVGDGDERYFAHQSIGEFLLARKLADVLESSDYPLELGHAELSELTARFLRDLAPEAGTRWLRAMADGRA